MRRRRLVVLAALLLLGACGLVALPSALSTSDATGTVTATVDDDGSGASPVTVLQQPPGPAVPTEVALRGSTSGLVPGRAGQVLPVVVGNPVGNPPGTVLTVTQVRAEARGPAGSCPAADLRVTPVTGAFRVDRGQSVVVPLPVLLVDRPDRDQSGCRGVTFPLRLTAVAQVTR